MNEQILYAIIKQWIECEMLYEKHRTLEANENEDFQKGYICALMKIDSILNGG